MKNKKYRLFLISGKQKHRHYVVQIEFARLLGKRKVITNLALPVLASLTPDHYDIKIIDEEIIPIPKNDLPDIVGITISAATLKRSYEIADWYRSKGVKVIFGGSYITFIPEEGILHADSVVIGEAEGIWEKVLEDFEKGELKQIYKSDNRCEYKTAKMPRWDLVDTSKILSLGVQASRGCPYQCEFCLVSQMFGRKVRFRDVDDVIEEIKNLPIKKFLFVDDNLTINKKYAKELLAKLKPLGYSWSCQASLDLAKDEELLKEMADAGCHYLLMGFESVNKDSLNETSKHQNKVAEYEEAIHRIHKAGMEIYGSFVIGFDNDTLDEFDNIFDFTMKANLPLVILSILGATPGTDLFARLEKEGRWYGSDTDYRGGTFPVIHYNKISQSDIFEKYVETIERLYSWDTLKTKALNLFGKGYFVEEYENEDATFIMKFKISFLITRLFLFSRDKSKRALFLALFKMFRKKQVAVSKVVVFLLHAEGTHRHIQKMKLNMDEYREMIKSVDQGTWEEIQQRNKAS
ncbi:MAG: radical SAM protein [Bacteroidetes bacterium]|nr:radical SAM protein [Bacteroidota bacterium]